MAQDLGEFYELGVFFITLCLQTKLGAFFDVSSDPVGSRSGKLVSLSFFAGEQFENSLNSHFELSSGFAHTPLMDWDFSEGSGAVTSPSVSGRCRRRTNLGAPSVCGTWAGMIF